MLHRNYPVTQITAALEHALAQRTVCYAAVRQWLEGQAGSVEPAPVTVAAELAHIRVQQPPLAVYNRLLKGGVLH